jgi:hypothetical protein
MYPESELVKTAPTRDKPRGTVGHGHKNPQLFAVRLNRANDSVRFPRRPERHW